MRLAPLIALLSAGACAPAPQPPALDLSACAPIRDGAGAAIMGGEDAAVSPLGLLVSFDDRRGEGRGSIRVLGGDDSVSADLTQGMPAAFHPHGIGVHVDDEGAATLMVINHGQGWEGPASSVEIYALEEGVLLHVETIVLDGMARLNDVTPVSPQSFYATNESEADRHSWRNATDFMLRRGSGALAFHDGQSTRIIANDLAFANSVERLGASTLAVSDSIRGEVRIFEGDVDIGGVELAEVIDVGAGPDNLTADGEGGLLVARHDNLQHFAQFARGARATSRWSIAAISPAAGEPLRVLGGEDGRVVSAIAVAATTPSGDVLLGSVFDGALLCPAQALGRS
ncbi:MAG TPA: hypothetical protein VM915_00770 [Verrucomicrobiae bacterium]|jgi:hypothetical protein|nr:hypothetical protein [Verrucomicrobiae bacterium]